MKELKAQVKEIEQILDIIEENQVRYCQREHRENGILHEYSYFSGREAEYMLNRLNRMLILEGWQSMWGRCKECNGINGFHRFECVVELRRLIKIKEDRRWADLEGFITRHHNKYFKRKDKRVDK